MANKMSNEELVRKNEQIRKWFTETRRGCFSVSGFERQAGIPAKTMDHFFKGRRMLDEHNLGLVAYCLRKFGFEFDERGVFF